MNRTMKITNRLLSLLLAFVLVLTLVPTTVFAENTAGTAESPVKVTTFQELRDAMKDENIDYVEIAQDITYTLKYQWREKYDTYTEEEKKAIDITDFRSRDIHGKPGNVAIVVNGTKHLMLSHNMDIKCSKIVDLGAESKTGFETLFYISSNAHLYVDGNGTISCEANNYLFSYWPSMFELDYFCNNTKLTINGGNFLCSPGTRMGKISVIASTGDGEIEINGGTFRVRSYSPIVEDWGEGREYVFLDRYLMSRGTEVIETWPTDVLFTNKDTKLTINGGTFGTTDDTYMRVPVLSLAMLDCDSPVTTAEQTKNITINGGVFETGILYGGTGLYGPHHFITDSVWNTMLGEGCSIEKSTYYKTGYYFDNTSEKTQVEMQKVVVTKKNSLVLDYGERISQNGGYAQAEISSTRYTATTEVEPGSEVTIKPVPLKNYVFDHWELSSDITLTEGSTTSETIKFTMPVQVLLLSLCSKRLPTVSATI